MPELFDNLLKANREWVDKKKAEDADFFSKLAKGQSPKFLWIGCSDSRVPANEITGTQPGEIFVHRNIANMVVHTDMNMLSVLQYAVEVLKVRHVIVCGHYGCGGVAAALGNNSFGLIDNWIRNIKDVYRLHKEELEDIQDENVKLKRLVELNVLEQVYNLSKTSVIQEAWSKGDGPYLHACVYNLGDGLLKDLKVMYTNDKDINDPIYIYDFLEQQQD